MQDDIHCPICLNNLYGECNECQIGTIEKSQAAGRCISEEEVCNHIFRKHCIEKVLASQSNKCPIDKSKWKCKNT